MAVLPWAHSRSRTTSNEKRQKTALEWFSRSGGGAEPSRQALNSLMKEHTRTNSSGSASLKSRSSTAQSHRSKHSQSSQLMGTDTKDHEQSTHQSRPMTPQFLELRPISPTYSLSSALDLFSMSSGLKRKGSKMSMNSEISASGALVSPTRLVSSRLGFRKRESPTSPTKSENRTLPISQPYAFQHLTHSEQSHFNGLSRIDESELATQFGAVQASQNPELGLRGIQANTLPIVSQGQPCTPSPQSNGQELPMTPPRPSPPPKDSPQRMTPLPSLEVRMSRSMENFSRPTPRSPSSPMTVSPIHLQPSLLPGVVEADESATNSTKKPLPHLPSIGHAVSTNDDTAQSIRFAPLPSPPLEHDFHVPSPSQFSPKGSLRHMSTFPSARYQQRYSTIEPGTQLMGTDEERAMLPRHRSEDALTRYTQRFSRRLSSLPKNDWEDAIDFAWDHADEQSFDGDDSSDSTSTAAGPAPRHLTAQDEQRTDGPDSTRSTPLMMNSATAYQPSSSSLENETCLTASTSSGQIYGLGIDANSDVSPVGEQVTHPILGITIPPSSEDCTPYQLPRTTYSALSKSSSQESIILSIASSILGTQRSSNSSVSPSELSRLSKCDEPTSAATSAPSPLLTVEHQKPARPESTCIPISLLKDFAMSASRTELSTSVEDSHSEQAKSDQDIVMPLPSDVTDVEDASTTSPVNSPQQYNSNATAANRTPRKRSNTQTSRRNGRGSYSLFPSAPAHSTTPSVMP